MHQYAWWGWWAKPEERIPRQAFAELTDHIATNGSLGVLLADSGEKLLYRATISQINIPVGNTSIDSPERDKTPDYYIERTCKAWFKVTAINECDHSTLEPLSYNEVAELIEDPNSSAFANKHIFNFGEMISRLYRTVYFAQPFDPNHHAIHEVKLTASPRQPAVFSLEPRIRPSNYIIHISDLHFGKSNFPDIDIAGQRSLASLFAADLAALKMERPAAVIISGDLTWRGDPAEFQEALTFVTRLQSLHGVDTFLDLVIVPGNHDIKWADQSDDKCDLKRLVTYSGPDAERNYRNFFSRTIGVPGNTYLSMGRRYLLQNYVTVDILGLNSCRLEGRDFSGYGYVGLDQIADGASRMGWSEERNTVNYRLAILHHHLVPVSPVEDVATNHFSLTLDAGQLLYKMQDFGVDVASHGHQHQPFLSSISKPVKKDSAYEPAIPILIHGAGSIGVAREKLGRISKNSYSIYQFDRKGITMMVRATSDNFDGFNTWSTSRIVRTDDGGLIISRQSTQN
jgi:3',5'-cyclic AMP phosphodiesterase CpdA